MNPEKIALYYQNGSSDKVYQAQLNAVEGGWEVTAQNGRRGSTLVHRKKTKVPVHFDVAKKIYDKLVRTKQAAGYTSNGSGVAFTDTKDAGNVTGYLPQLLNEITENEVYTLYTQHKVLWLQTKHDGERRGMLANDHEAIGANRRGLVVPLQTEIHAASIALTRQCGGTLELDTEDMGNHLVIFDVLNHSGEDLRPMGFGARAVRLARVDTEISRHSLRKHLRVDLPMRPKNITDIAAFIKTARMNNEEGIVVRLNAPITPGRPNSGGPCLKLKFWESATCMVFSNHDTKRSIGLAVYDGEEVTFVGNCTVPEKYDIPEVEKLVEIKYLYAYKGGSLFEPSYKGLRTDLTHSAASITQLKYKK